MKTSPITLWLRNTHPTYFSIYVMFSAFCSYSCMYGFRKTFTATTFQDIQFWGIDYKIWLIIAQVMGYLISKFIGIKIISEFTDKGRGTTIVILILIAELALLGFAVVPMPYNIFFLFLNGLPLGLIWGLVFHYLEGRKTTELLGAGLVASFVFAAGFVLSIGKWLMQEWGVSEIWMPFLAGVLFFVPLCVFVWLLEQIPPPNEADIRLRVKRFPMKAKERWIFLREFSLGIFFLVVAFMLLTAFRDFRDNFSAEIWNSLGYGKSTDIFTLTAIPIALSVLVLMSILVFVKNNFYALMIYHLYILIGFGMTALSTWLFELQLMNAPTWMIWVGLGLYLGYVPFNSIMFDRLIAAFKHTGNVGFIMYLADSFGYLGSVVVLFYKNFAQKNVSWLDFFIASSYWVGIVGFLLTSASMMYFFFKYKRTIGRN